MSSRGNCNITTVSAADLFCNLITMVYPVQLLPFCNKTITFDCRSSISLGLYQDVFILSQILAFFFQHIPLFFQFHTHRQTDRDTQI